MEFFLDGGELAVETGLVGELKSGVALGLLEFSLELLLLIRNIFNLILTRSKFPLRSLSITSPLLDLSPQLALQLQFLFLYVLDIMLQLYVIIFIL